MINTNGPVLRVRENLELVELETSRSSTKTLTEAERDNIVGVLEDCGWRVEGPHGAARILGINPSTLRSTFAIREPLFEPCVLPTNNDRVQAASDARGDSFGPGYFQ